jgi:hypothetical protein
MFSKRIKSFIIGFLAAFLLLVIDMILSSNQLLSVILGFLPLILGYFIFRSAILEEIERIYFSTFVFHLALSGLASFFSQNLIELLAPIILSYANPGGLPISLSPSPVNSLIGLLVAFLAIYGYKRRILDRLFHSFDE